MSKTLCTRTAAVVATLLLALPLSAAPPSKEKRCGWIVNPTPANWWLVDRMGEWTIGAQGGFQAPGLDAVPDLTGREWVVTNGSSYGYGCACMTVTSNKKARRITRIYAVQQKPIRQCRTDSRLPPPE